MALHEVSPGKFVVQLFRADPLKEKQLRLCKRVKGRDAAVKQERTFEAQAAEWCAHREVIRQARARGIVVASPSVTSSATSFADYLTRTYLPWAKVNLDARTLEARAGSLLIIAEDLGNTPLADVEHRVGALVEKWKVEGCRYSVTVDRLGRQLNRKPRPISDAGLNERTKILRAVLGHAHMHARILATRPRISLIRKKRAAPGASEPVRYFSVDERVRFLRYANADMADVFQLALLTGMRPGELFHLRVGSVDPRNRKLMVEAGPCPHCPDGKWIPKTGEYRAIDIADGLMPILRRMLKDKRDDEFVITNVHGRPFSRLRGGNGAFARTLRRAGLDRKGLSFYSTRHTFASDLVSNGRSLQEVAALLGNSPRTCELFYAHLQPGHTREAVKTLKVTSPWAPEAAGQGGKRRRGHADAAGQGGKRRRGHADAAAGVSTADRTNADVNTRVTPTEAETEAA